MFTCASYKWSNLFVNNFFSKSEERKVHAFFACQSNIILSRLSVFVIDKKRSSHFFAVHNKDVFMTFWNVSSHAIRVFLVETVICSATDSMTATREKKKVLAFAPLDLYYSFHFSMAIILHVMIGIINLIRFKIADLLCSFNR